MPNFNLGELDPSREDNFESLTKMRKPQKKDTELSFLEQTSNDNSDTVINL